MAVPRPAAEGVAKLAAREHYGLGPEEVPAFTAAVSGALASYDAVDALYVVGNAVVLAVGEADVVGGGDQGGSVRLPASRLGSNWGSIVVASGVASRHE